MISIVPERAPRCGGEPKSGSPPPCHSRQVRVLIADDHPVVRAGLRALLNAESAIKVIGEAADGSEAVSLSADLAPDVVIMDLLMPCMDGLQATYEIKKWVPSPRVLVLSCSLDEERVEQLLRAGADGYLLKEAAACDLLNGIHQICNGNRFFGPVTSRRLRVQIPEALLARSQGKRTRRLTLREREVLQMIAEGAPSKQIAYDLGISIKTVEKHRGTLMRKLDIHEVAGLTRYALCKGILASAAGT